MGKVRGKSVKRASRSIIEMYFSRVNKDFENNLSVVRDVTITQNKRIRNQIAGYVTRLYNRIQKGVVKGIYIKSHEAEKEMKERFIPKVGVLDVEKVMVDPVTFSMIKKYQIQGNYASVGSERSQ
ncbi:uncharacterized protein VICG_01627 [Vittaforma corneae ATCC 50505]|uniref:30S ribosomal protein S17e n=1 Tax=Vittaforma corneae (strain ATCC 50505) TaxID=993615 RepID=L2GKK5_VITCO|nr:uncharacterized protein VICG_01627 [Vittaforma corneae ATCC 50505]ELA41386.1 hypothetical protein VICG_01627 [Vittaforma corneae ATCC 50505]